MPDMKKVTASREENTAYMNKILPVKDSFDIIQRDIYIGGRAASFYFIDGFMKDETMLKIMDSFMKVTVQNHLSKTIRKSIWKNFKNISHHFFENKT